MPMDTPISSSPSSSSSSTFPSTSPSTSTAPTTNPGTEADSQLIPLAPPPLPAPQEPTKIGGSHGEAPSLSPHELPAPITSNFDPATVVCPPNEDLTETSPVSQDPLIPQTTDVEEPKALKSSPVEVAESEAMASKVDPSTSQEASVPLVCDLELVDSVESHLEPANLPTVTNPKSAILMSSDQETTILDPSKPKATTSEHIDPTNPANQEEIPSVLPSLERAVETQETAKSSASSQELRNPTPLTNVPEPQNPTAPAVLNPEATVVSQTLIRSSYAAVENPEVVPTFSVQRFTTTIKSITSTLPTECSTLHHTSYLPSISPASAPTPSPSPAPSSCSFSSVPVVLESPGCSFPLSLSFDAVASPSEVGLGSFEGWSQDGGSSLASPRTTIKTGRCLDPVLRPCVSWADTKVGGDASWAISRTAIKTVLVYPFALATPRKALRAAVGDNCASAAAARMLRTASTTWSDFDQDSYEEKKVFFCPATPRRALRARNAVPQAATTHGGAIKTESVRTHSAIHTPRDGDFAGPDISASLLDSIKTEFAVAVFTASPRPPIKSEGPNAFPTPTPRPSIKTKAIFHTAPQRRPVKKGSLVTHFSGAPWKVLSLKSRTHSRVAQPPKAFKNRESAFYPTVRHERYVEFFGTGYCGIVTPRRPLRV